MAEVIGVVASAIAVVQLSSKIAKLCTDYSAAVTKARADIQRLQKLVEDIQTTAQDALAQLQGPSGPAMVTSGKLLRSLDDCKTQMSKLEAKLDQGKDRGGMRRFGFRALKWPFQSQEVDAMVNELQQYQQNFILGMQLDQFTLLVDIRRKVDDSSLQDGQARGGGLKLPGFVLPFEMDPDFVDRPEVMKWLKEQYDGPYSRMALVAMGGFGKSQMAIQLGYYIHKAYPKTSIFWVHASSQQRFEEGFKNIADHLRIPYRDNPGVNLLKLVCDTLQDAETGPWLLILDNADSGNVFFPAKNGRDQEARNTSSATEYQASLGSFLPRSKFGKILVTSRSLDVAERLTGGHKTIFQLSPMDETQALQLFQNKLKDGTDSDRDSEQVISLLDILDCIPLAVTQAASYINRRIPRMSAGEYLKLFRSNDGKRRKLLAKEAADHRRDDSAVNSVLGTWQITFEELRDKHPSAADLLSFMSYFSAQGIPTHLLPAYRNTVFLNMATKPITIDEIMTMRSAQESDIRADEIDYDDDLDDDLDILTGYSMISVAMADQYKIHSLVQFCTRAWLSSTSAEKWRRIFLCKLSAEVLGSMYSVSSVRICRMLLPHIESIERPSRPDELQIWSILLGITAGCLLYTRDPKTIHRLASTALEVAREVCEPTSRPRHCLMWIMTESLLATGEHVAAELLSREWLELTRESFGADAKEALTGMQHLSRCLCLQGRYKEAEGFSMEAVKICEKEYGMNHERTLSYKSALAWIWLKQGQVESAVESQTGVVEGYKRIENLIEVEYGVKLAIAKAQIRLAAMLAQACRFEEAEESNLEGLEKIKVLFGEDHGFTIWSMELQARLIAVQGRLAEAESLLGRVVELHRERVGKDHSKTLQASQMLHLLAELRYSQEHSQEANDSEPDSLNGRCSIY